MVGGVPLVPSQSGPLSPGPCCGADARSAPLQVSGRYNEDEQCSYDDDISNVLVRYEP